MQKFFNKDFFRGAVAATLIILSAYAFTGSGASVTSSPIKPTGKVAVSDEQQGILAVRSAKASVVSIVGTAIPNTAPTSSPTLYSLNNVAGTGFIVDSSGLIVSNNHVVEDSTLTYTVQLVDGTQYAAKVLALDKYDDVAILKINASGLPVAKLGDSGQLETGQTVFAIGNALGRYQNSVTKGVVSGLGRAVSEPTDAPSPRLQDLIQTDAAINPGNSGGPLINMAGEVIGMDTLIDTQGSGLGFAIPINTVKTVVQQLQSYGKVQKPYMGVQFVTVDGQIKVLKNLPVSNGAYLSSVVPGGPADKAGLKMGNVIIAINHEVLTQRNELDTVVGKYAPGTQILVTYMDGTVQTDTVLILGILP